MEKICTTRTEAEHNGGQERMCETVPNQKFKPPDCDRAIVHTKECRCVT